MVGAATLESQSSPEELAALREPQEHDPSPVDDRYLKHAIQNFIDLLGSPENTYTCVSRNHQELHPEDPVFSYDQVKRRVRKLSGVITWENHMCTGGCIGFTGPFSDLEECPDCGEPRYNQAKLNASEGLVKVPRKVFTTFPVGPQLQARWRSPETAERMRYRWRKTQDIRQERAESGGITGIYDDVLSGEAYLHAVENGSIREQDIVLMFSIDGAQLYRHGNIYRVMLSACSSTCSWYHSMRTC